MLVFVEGFDAGERGFSGGHEYWYVGGGRGELYVEFRVLHPRCPCCSYAVTPLPAQYFPLGTASVAAVVEWSA